MKVIALIKRIIQQMVRDKRTLGLLFLAPLLVLTLMYFFFNGDEVEPRIGAVGVDDAFGDVLEEAGFTLKAYDRLSADTVVEDDLHGMIELDDGTMTLLLKNNDPSRAKSIKMIAVQSLSAYSIKQLGMEGADMSIDTTYVYGNEDTEYFDVLSPILVGFFIFFFVFLISGISLLQERVSGTLERMMATPIKKWEIILAYLIGYGFFAMIQTVIVVFYAVNVLDIVLVGSIWHVLLINLLLALVALTIGIFLSTFASSEFQMMQFIPVVVIPQIFFAGIIPFEGMAEWLQQLGKVMPMYYAADALKGVMYKGDGLSEISADLYALLIFAAVFIIFNIITMRRYRKV